MFAVTNFGTLSTLGKAGLKWMSGGQAASRPQVLSSLADTVLDKMGLSEDGKKGDSLLWTMSSVIVLKGLERAWKTLEGRYGSAGGARFLEESSKKLSTALAHPANGARVARLGQVQRGWLQHMSSENKVFVAASTAVLGAYLHKAGATIMKERVPLMKADFENPVEAGTLLENENRLEKFLFDKLNWKQRCYGLYTQNAYYTDAKDGSYLTLNPAMVNPVRAVTNVLIGLLSKLPMVNLKTQDPIDTFLVWAQMTGYWEVLARLVGLYGWAPVYVASRALIDITRTEPSAKPIKKGRANGKSR
jgi:hypothetical protein